jgi:hypothetical protein
MSGLFSKIALAILFSSEKRPGKGLNRRGNDGVWPYAAGAMPACSCRRRGKQRRYEEAVTFQSTEVQGKAGAAMPSSAAELQVVKGKAYILAKQLSRAAHRALNAERAKAYSLSRLFRPPQKASTSSNETTEPSGTTAKS